jgi:glycosyltransferase involved in cell wall biosynthesis
MKILNFISGKDLGGPKQSFILYTKVLDAMGYDVISVVKKGAKIKDILLSKNLKVYEVNYLRLSFWFLKKLAIYKLSKSLIDIKPDLIFVHKQIDIELLRGVFGDIIPIIGIAHWYSYNHIQYSSSMIAVSYKVKEYLIEKGYKKDIFVIPNMTEFSKDIKIKSLPNIPTIGSMGVFRRKKGFHTLIKALGILKTRKIYFKAIIAGRGQLYPYLKYLQYKLNLQEELIIKDWISNDERNNFIDNLDIFILPSRIETFGMVIIEAMARAKRIIATKCGGAEEIITNEIDGYLVEIKNPKLLADKIEYMIKNPTKSDNFPINARKKVIDKYSINTISKLIKEVVISFKT